MRAYASAHINSRIVFSNTSSLGQVPLSMRPARIVKLKSGIVVIEEFNPDTVRTAADL